VRSARIDTFRREARGPELHLVPDREHPPAGALRHVSEAVRRRAKATLSIRHGKVILRRERERVTYPD
jgi:hypothetical protein